MNSKTFCYLPFSNSLIKTNGDLSVCCHYKQQPGDKVFNIDCSSMEEWMTSDQQKVLQTQLLNGVRAPGCNYCYSLEDSGFESLRTRTINEFKLYKPSIDYPEVISIEADIENVCNLKCMMCSETASSELLKENKKLKLSNFNQKDFVWTQTRFDNLIKIIESKKLKLLNIRAGEPLFNKKIKKMLQVIPAEYLRKTLLHITSNMTIWNDEWAEIFGKFKYVRLMASIDGIGKNYEYIRFPSNWETTEKNLLEVKKLSNVKMVLRCTIQNLNIVYLDEFINWATTNNLYIGAGAYGILLHPPRFSYLNLTPELKDLAIKKLSLIKNNHLMVEPLVYNLRQSLFNEPLWSNFVDHVKLKDNFRQISISNYLPDFKIY